MGMEIVKYGTLQKLISDKFANGGRITDFEGGKIMQTICRAVVYIHDKGVIHRDLKTANILLDDPDDFDSIKIIDFGLCER
jgi:calcium/calmodulin-dependent protein kinase I